VLITQIAHAQCARSADVHERSGSQGRSCTRTRTAAAGEVEIETVHADIPVSREVHRLAYHGSR